MVQCIFIVYYHIMEPRGQKNCTATINYPAGWLDTDCGPGANIFALALTLTLSMPARRMRA